MMKLMRVVGSVAVAAAMMVGAGSAHAIDLRNEDERGYVVTVTSSSMTRELPLRGLTLSLIVCVGECTFDVAGVGKVRARGSDVVRIKDGRVTMIPEAPTALR